MQTQTIQEAYYNIRARLNSGATERDAVIGTIREAGPIRTVRVSSAQSSTSYSYWGAVRYAIQLSVDGKRLVNSALERASSDRRSIRLAEQDASDIAVREGRAEVYTIGGVRSVEVLRFCGVE